MQIHGLQKMTLLDFPGRVACTIFLAGCDFNCPFCHNAGLLAHGAEPMMDDAELISFLSKRKGLLDGVCITGGEPLLRKEIGGFIGAIRELGFKVKLDTNGSHPERLSQLVSGELLDYVAMDIKNSPDRYPETAGMADLDVGPIAESAAFLMESSVESEFRTTVVAELHDCESFRAIGSWIAGAKRYFLQPFVDREAVRFGNLHAPSDEDLAKYLGIVRETIPTAQIRGREV